MWKWTTAYAGYTGKKTLIGIVKKKQLAPMEKDRKANDCIGRIKMAHVFITTVVPRIATPVPIGENAYVAKADTFCKTANAFPNANGTNTGMNLVNVSRVRI